MRIQWELKILSSDKLHLLKVLKIVSFNEHGETQVQLTEQAKGKQYTLQYATAEHE